jgi:hypothetical protein
VVWHHPTVSQVDIFQELDGEQLRIDLDDRPNYPIADAHSAEIMITKYFGQIAYTIGLFTIWCR